MNSLVYFGFVVLSGASVFFIGVNIGQDSMEKAMQLQATQHCSAEYDRKTGEFRWIDCKGD
jgi:hypothetical protein